MSLRLSDAVFSSLPSLRHYASMERSGELDGLSLYVAVPSPTEDPERELVIWVDQYGSPSVGFGPTHDHGSLHADDDDEDGIFAMLGLVSAILQGDLLIVEEAGDENTRCGYWIDLREPDALMECLTEPDSPGRLWLKSWSGKADREVSLESLEVELEETWWQRLRRWFGR